MHAATVQSQCVFGHCVLRWVGLIIRFCFSVCRFSFLHLRDTATAHSFGFTLVIFECLRCHVIAGVRVAISSRCEICAFLRYCVVIRRVVRDMVRTLRFVM